MNLKLDDGQLGDERSGIRIKSDAMSFPLPDDATELAVDEVHRDGSRHPSQVTRHEVTASSISFLASSGKP